MSDPMRAAASMSRHEPQGDGQVAHAAALLGPWGAVAHRGADEASALLKRLFRSFDGSVALRLWNGATLSLGQNGAHESNPRFTLVCHHPGVVRSMVLGRDPLCLVEAYFRGHVDVEGDFFAALSLKDHLHSIRLSFLDRLGALLAAFRLGATDHSSPGSGTSASPLRGSAVKAHSKTENRASISFHYDVSNEFYRLWLDEERVYSCAYFTSADESLDQAQRNKLEHICRKLRLRPGERLLDIGCGWGAMICWAARHHGVRAHGITLSRQQLDYTQQRIGAEGLQDLVTVELLDYRDLAGKAVYDKVSSIGMFEHVGLANLPAYLATVQRVLRPGGLFLNHGITHDEEEPTYRVWRLYMAACALDFEGGSTGIYQILASRPNKGEWPVPLSRSDLYTAPDSRFRGVN